MTDMAEKNPICEKKRKMTEALGLRSAGMV
jgi:hypothetical protein